MLKSVTAIQFLRAMGSGRTRPCLMGCVKPDGTEVELVVKLRAGCDTGDRSLTAEAIAALLATDLDLPVPEPFSVLVEKDFAETIGPSDIRDLALRSLGWNFGSYKLPPGFFTLPLDRPLATALLPTAAEILAFDLFIENPDRRKRNPNCLTNGRALVIYDHELAFFIENILGWRPPWVPGAIHIPGHPDPREQHVFLDQVRGKDFDFSRLRGAIEAIPEARLQEYSAALPRDWLTAYNYADPMISHIRDLKENIAGAVNCLREALR